MRATTLATAAILAVFGAGCSGIQVNSAWAPQAAVTPLGPAFAWPPHQPPVEDGQGIVDEGLSNLIVQKVEKGLVARGYVKSSPEAADLWVKCRIGSEVLHDPRTQNYEPYTEGTLAVYALNPKTGRWLWRSWANARLNPSNPPEVKRQRLDQAITMILKQFPQRRAGE